MGNNSCLAYSKEDGTQQQAIHNTLLPKSKNPRYEGLHFDPDVSNKIRGRTLLISAHPVRIEVGYLMMPTTQKMHALHNMNYLAANVMIVDQTYYANLEAFQYGEDALTYMFADWTITLSIMKMQNLSVIYNLHTPAINVTALFDCGAATTHTPLSTSNANSCEFDKVVEFLRVNKIVRVQSAPVAYSVVAYT